MDKKGHRFTASERLKQLEIERVKEQEIEERRVYSGIASAMLKGVDNYTLTRYDKLNSLTVEHLEADEFMVEERESLSSVVNENNGYVVRISW